MADLIDLQIQFRRAKKTSSDGTQSTHEVLATIDGSGSWRGESTIDYTQLAEAEQVPRQYGKRLGEVLFNPAIMNALRQARGLLERPVRIRLWLEIGPNGEREDQHGLRWERAYVVVNEKDWPLAIAPGLPFSRYVPPNPSIRMPPMTQSSICWSCSRARTTWVRSSSRSMSTPIFQRSSTASAR